MPHTSSRRKAAALLAAALVLAPFAAQAASVKLPEGTELRIRFNDKLSSGTNSEGDQFAITLDEPVTLNDGTVIAAGYRGKGEVTEAKKKGFMGQAGELNIRLNNLRIGETRVHIRANKGGEGKGAMGATIALTVLFGPLGLLKHGHDIEIKPGQTITAYVDEDTMLNTPLEPPPKGE
ncbi:hypothetical protein [Phenylobacterium aquaticum]|uniref:hypothetical protein n=1 Tax=Phenylobacterium aquaticum TaxID=1763816 RepID=UPI001F5DA6AD|nr:hypothetical protein [Phenylobacterium aquaticum]MCI3133670.1 hypothetical protein [Phenylobacterium aquaticum]